MSRSPSYSNNNTQSNHSQYLYNLPLSLYSNGFHHNIPQEPDETKNYRREEIENPREDVSPTNKMISSLSERSLGLSTTILQPDDSDTGYTTSFEFLPKRSSLQFQPGDIRNTNHHHTAV